jgi:acyl-coenzyme A thioesterase 9
VKILHDRDIVMDGHVSWVGRSSMESTMRLMQQQDGDNWRQLLKAKFVMVSRNPHGSGVVANHPLQSNNAQEAVSMREGQGSRFCLFEILSLPSTEQC